MAHFTRRIVLTCGRLYRTVSYLPATTITNIPPLILTVSAASEYRRRVRGWPAGEVNKIMLASLKDRLRVAVEKRWQQWYESNTKGRWTKKIIPKSRKRY